MSDLSLEEQAVGARVLRTLAYNQDLAAGAKVKAKFDDDEVNETVPAGKSWNVQASLYIVETDA